MPNHGNRDTAQREFHVSREARDRYNFEKPLFSLNGNVLFANFHAARVFAKKMNDKRDLVNYPEKAVRAGQINAMGLIDEILHYVVGLYQTQRNAEAMEAALEHLEETLGEEQVDKALHAFVEEFPTVAVYQGEMTVDEYLEGETDGTPHRRVALEEMLMLWLANANPAFSPFMELFDDEHLEKHTRYLQVVEEMRDFFEEQPHFGPDDRNLVEMLREPAIEEPHSLEGQLEYIRKRWGPLLGRYLYRLLSSLDFLAEEEKMFFGFGPGPSRVYEFGGMEGEAERFSADLDWMPKIVLIAKNVFVWLDQLSKQYGREIRHLDQVPNAELDKLARWGITGLWLIGLWERSEASKRIKQIMGNPDAVASAYSLYDYVIANDLGGEEAYNDLKARAQERGIRMASDMVPNHVAIDSRWVIEHPDWFVQLDYSPFPSYTFNGPDLCDEARVGVYIEDHYYDRSDAAVVFKRVDHWTGDTRFIYHGNDGTSMPWNDTAQLNYLLPEVREAVIQTILHVARRSSVIRFDAAMTLAKKHYQRLWFPQPGSGGDIPSRAQFSMTKEAFNEAFPKEFWREVVDRVAEEVPDTLLLAEAFWLMEGYFVRTLGMHRVYNSAFMNMLRDEKNAEYRQLIKNTLEFNPEILKRYVNFMNNPDERTAVDQFGKGDKYFGIATLLATMPGLPMFGHGQVEGYAEKYGMEFRRAYWDEQPEPYLVQRHEREIFPLLHQRYLFANVQGFYLYDFYTPDGSVDENVFAYSNRAGNAHSLVLYHNRYAETAGWVRSSVAYAVKGPEGEKRLEQKSLAAGLGIPDDPNTYLIFRDAVDNMEYIRNCRELAEKGLYAQLDAYKAHVFLDFRQVQENEWGQYGQLTAYLEGRGVPNIDEAMKELFLEPVLQPLRMLISAEAFEWLMDARTEEPGEAVAETLLAQVRQKMIDLLEAAENATIRESNGQSKKAIASRVMEELDVALSLATRLEALDPDTAGDYEEVIDYVLENLQSRHPAIWGTLLAWLFIHPLGKVVDGESYREISRSWVDEWLLGKVTANALQEMGVDEAGAWRAVSVVKILLGDYGEMEAEEARSYLRMLLRDQTVQTFIGVNRYQETLWFNKESFERLLWWLMIRETVQLLADGEEDALERIAERYAFFERLLEAQEASDYQIEKLLDAVE
ncbi:MAG: alpha-amylase family glycosyl hydrolase [Anaerolineales bacterium]